MLSVSNSDRSVSEPHVFPASVDSRRYTPGCEGSRKSYQAIQTRPLLAATRGVYAIAPGGAPSMRYGRDHAIPSVEVTSQISLFCSNVAYRRPWLPTASRSTAIDTANVFPPGASTRTGDRQVTPSEERE